MPRRQKAVAADAPKVQSSGTAGKLRFYEILYHLNQGFEQVLAQLQELERFGIRREASKKFQLIVEETRAQVNFELVEFLQERELKDWAYFGRLRQEQEKEYGDQVDRLRKRSKPRTRREDRRGAS